MNNLINYLYEKDLPILASAIEARGIKWGIVWIKTKSKIDINENDITLSDDEITKLKNIEKVDKQELMSIALGLSMNGNNNIESRLRRTTRTLLALISTVIIFYIFFKMIHGDYSGAEKGANKEITIYILGVLSALASQVFSFYFGSSESGNANKNGNTQS